MAQRVQAEKPLSWRSASHPDSLPFSPPAALPPPQLWPLSHQARPGGVTQPVHPAAWVTILAITPRLPCALGLPPMSASLRVPKARSQLGVHQHLTPKAQPDTTLSCLLCTIFCQSTLPSPHWAFSSGFDFPSDHSSKLSLHVSSSK